ncbi:MAG: hypothetical protein KIT62_06330 [Cyclobacteriaceae bacterium]|nr:hypothetical protein [Cyclobacteriaceae bacterium]
MKRFLFIGILSLTTLAADAQDVGLSFSYFIPRNGYFSTPISPFSFRGVGVNLNKFIALETGFSLYRMSGMNMLDLPFSTKDPLLGPNFTLFVPAELVLEFKGKQAEFDIKGGGFFFYGFDQKLNLGNFDRAIRQHEQWDVANSDLSFKNNPGFGYHAGVEFTFPVTRQFSLSFEINYLVGTAKFPLNGSYTGGTVLNGFETVNVDYKDAKVDFTGLEFSIGVIFGSGR